MMTDTERTALQMQLIAILEASGQNNDYMINLVVMACSECKNELEVALRLNKYASAMIRCYVSLDKNNITLDSRKAS